MGHMLFLVKPCEKTEKLPVYEPEVEIEDGPAASEPAAPAGALRFEPEYTCNISVSTGYKESQC